MWFVTVTMAASVEQNEVILLPQRFRVPKLDPILPAAEESVLKHQRRARAEREFLKSLARLGIGDMTTVASMRSFNSFLAWVHEDLEERERFVKTGWTSWPRLREGSAPE